jgi:hypothetical protein
MVKDGNKGGEAVFEQDQDVEPRMVEQMSR